MSDDLRVRHSGGGGKLLLCGLLVGTLFAGEVSAGGGFAAVTARGNSPTNETVTSAHTLQPGDWLLVARYADRAVWATVDTAGWQWSVVSDAGTGLSAATLVNYTSAYDPASAPGTQNNFQPDASKWNTVWDAAAGTWTAVAPGATFPSGVSGRTTDGWNVVIIPAASGSGPPIGPAPTPGPLTVSTTANYDTMAATVTAIVGFPAAETTAVVSSNGAFSRSIRPYPPDPRGTTFQPPVPLPRTRYVPLYDDNGNIFGWIVIPENYPYLPTPAFPPHGIRAPGVPHYLMPYPGDPTYVPDLEPRVLPGGIFS